MPIFEYENAETGLTIDVYQSLTAVRDEIVENGITYKRRRVPSRLSTSRRTSPGDHQTSEVLKGYRALEDAGTLSKSSYTPAQVKAAWALPDNEG